MEVTQYLNLVSEEITGYLTNLGIVYDGTKMAYMGMLNNYTFSKQGIINLLLYTAPLSSDALEVLENFKWVSCNFLPTARLPFRSELGISEELYQEVSERYEKALIDRVCDHFTISGRPEYLTKFGDIKTDPVARECLITHFADNDMEHFSGYMFIDDRPHFYEGELEKIILVAGDSLFHVAIPFTDERGFISYVHCGLGARSGERYISAPSN